MNISKEGIDFICQFEGFRSQPYQDSVGVWTIGYGTTMYPNGLRVTQNDREITEDEGKTYLQHHIEHRVIHAITELPVTLKQNQIDALCSFIYNLGIGSFERSTLRKDIIQGADKAKIKADFGMWVKAGGNILPGLIKRRNAEADLYNS
jgi:lysozyme